MGITQSQRLNLRVKYSFVEQDNDEVMDEERLLIDDTEDDRKNSRYSQALSDSSRKSTRKSRNRHSSASSKMAGGRSRTSSRLSLRMVSLAKSLGPRRPKAIVMKHQRYRDDIAGDFYKESDNPLFGKQTTRKRRERKTNIQTEEMEIPSYSNSLPAKSLDTSDIELKVRRSKTHISKTIPQPPVLPKLRPRYYTDCEQHPFGKQKSYPMTRDKKQITKHNDITSQSFSAFSLSDKELREAAVDMILCTLNEDVIQRDKLFKKTSHRRRTRSKSRGIFSALKGKSVKKGTPILKEQTIRGRLTGTHKLSRSPSSTDATSGLESLEPPSCLSRTIRRAVRDFVNRVADGYTDTQYHSFKHAVDVTQMMFMLIFFLNKKLDRYQPFTMVISCLCHDLGHFGANNVFLKKENFTDNLFIQRFGTDSPLERYHFFRSQLVFNSSLLFSKAFMHSETRKKVEAFAEELILNTDMDRHKKCIAKAKEDYKHELELVRQGATGEVDFPLSFLILAIKLCDVANVCRSFNDAKRWTDVLSREFKAMGTIMEEGNSAFQASNGEKIKKLRMPEYEKTLRKANFVISNELSADSLIKYQTECADPDFADCSQLTLGFMRGVTQPMAELMLKVQPQAGWFLLSRMNQNQQSWIVAIKEADERENGP